MLDQEWLEIFRGKLNEYCDGKNQWKKITNLFVQIDVEDPSTKPDVVFPWGSRQYDLTKKRQRIFNRNVYNLIMAYELVPGIRRMLIKEIRSEPKADYPEFGSYMGIRKSYAQELLDNFLSVDHIKVFWV